MNCNPKYQRSVKMIPKDIGNDVDLEHQSKILNYHKRIVVCFHEPISIVSLKIDK